MQGTEKSERAGEAPRRNRRRKYVINPTFQLKYAGTIAVSVFLISSIIGSILYGVLHHQARMRLMNPETHTSEVATVVLLFGLAFAAVAAAGVGGWSVLVTHRICGPIFLFERWLAEVAEGRIPKLRPLRQKDEFKDFHQTFANAIGALASRKEAELAVFEELSQLVKTASSGDGLARRQALDSLAAQVETLRKEASAALGVQPDGGSEAVPIGRPEEAPAVSWA
ncbi:MAG: hypothetical protein JSV19_04100 [Phycisphaerales bacterium]|nr:MAG: hypothetical protein JSV19_04100 [Phycisphaerales bacterium]